MARLKPGPDEKQGLPQGSKARHQDTEWGALLTLRRVKQPKPNPEILIFDVDGVLVDVRESFWRSALETMRFLTGKRVTWAELYKWKNKPGNNDDWSMVSNWATALGRPTTYEEARDAFQQFYWDFDGRPGNVRREKMLISAKQVERWAKRFELDLFTGRTRQEFTYTFECWAGTRQFRTVVTMDDVARKKPHPDGLLKILGGRDPGTAVYVGDNIDDALAAREAGVRFMAILPAAIYGYRQRAAKFRELGALALLPRATAINEWLDDFGWTLASTGESRGGLRPLRRRPAYDRQARPPRSK
jgi:HAD superfamily phosphatase